MELVTPGDDEKLKRLTARIMSQQLDRSKPLWELWFAEGLGGDRWALAKCRLGCDTALAAA